MRLAVSAAALLVLAPLPALAQNAPQAAPAAAPAATPAPVADAAAADIDPARLAAAQQAVGKLFPDGTYARLLNGSFQGTIAKMTQSIADVNLRELMAASGMSAEEQARLGTTTLREVMEILDPAYARRMELTTKALFSGMVPVMARFEPSIRDGLAQAYARRFSVSQLADLNQFFATPTGSAYAADAMALGADPAVMGKMQAFMPELVKAMPQIMEGAKAATAELPAPKSWKDLTPAQRSKLAKLLGVSEAKLAPRTAAHH